MTVDPDLAAALAGLAEHARSGGRAVVALDFDGVLAPLQDDPAASRALPEAVEAMATLGGAPGVALALVSGRAVEDLAARAEVPPGTWLAGSHGAERGRWTEEGLERTEIALDAGAAAELAHIDERLAAAVAGTTARLERKPASVVLHTRRADAADAERLTQLAVALGDRPGVDCLLGKDVVELSVLQVTKGDALAALRREQDAGALLYAGDDVTDERAFATLGPDDVTVRVGPGETRARFRVPDADAFAGVLTHLAGLLTAR